MKFCGLQKVLGRAKPLILCHRVDEIGKCIFAGMVGGNGWMCWVQGDAGSVSPRCFLEDKIKTKLCISCIDFPSVSWIKKKGRKDGDLSK